MANWKQELYSAAAVYKTLPKVTQILNRKEVQEEIPKIDVWNHL